MSQALKQHTNKEFGLSPSIYMKRLLEVASGYGVERSSVLSRIGMTEESLEDSEIYYTIEQHVESLRAIQDTTPIPGLGLLVGQQISIADHGIMGYAMLSSPTLRKAIDIATRFQSLTDPILHIRFGIDGNDGVIIVEPLVLLGEAYRFDVEETLAIWQIILETFFGDNAGASLVRVTWEKPEYVNMYDDVFKCSTEFSAAANEFRFPAELVDQPLDLANDQAARICEQECARLLRKMSQGESILDTVRRIMINAPGRFPDLPEVAEKLKMSPRNLRRRLADLDTSFREISSDVRMHLATQYLSDTSLSVEQIAFLIGYGEASNFHRAFKKHVKMTPVEFRRQSREGRRSLATA